MQHDDADRLDLAPPPEPAAFRAFGVAVLAHLLLLLALTWGINWKRESDNVVAEAELWSSVPQQAAPAAVQPPPPAPAPVPSPPPAPAPPPAVAPPPPAPVSKQPDIALEREKKERELAERRQEELEREKKLEARKKQEELEREKTLEAQKKREAQQQELARKAAEEKEKRKAEAQALAKEKARQEEQAKAKARQQDTKLAALRKENLERMMKEVPGATGGPSATGTAERSSGPSQTYAGRIRARVRPNIVFTDDVSGNPTAEVEVRMAPDGTIISRRVTKSSGAKSWDDAVLRALDRTEILPRDVDGRVHSPLLLAFRPKE